MTEPEQPCIRGCCRDCKCDACLTASLPVHDPIPVPAADGWLCSACSSRLKRWLGSVLDDTLRLSTRIPDNYGWDHGHTHAKVSGSPALIRLEVAALVDPRTSTKVETEDIDYEENWTEIVHIPATIMRRAEDLKEEYELASPNTSMNDAVRLLTAQWERLVASTWVDEFYSDMSTIRQLLNRAHNRKPPLPRGRCFSCNTQLWQEDGNGMDSVTCPKCERVYDHLGLVKLKLQRDREKA